MLAGVVPGKTFPYPKANKLATLFILYLNGQISLNAEQCYMPKQVFPTILLCYFDTGLQLT